MKGSIAILLALGLAAGPAAAGTVVFTDGTFAPADYETAFVFSGDGLSTASFAQCASCGNPGTAMQLTFNEPSGVAVSIGMINTTFSYDPGTQGAITTIGAGVDKQFDNPYSDVSFGNYFRPLIEQNGNFFAAAITDGKVFGPGLSAYDTLSGAGLTATDFVEYDPLTGTFGAAHPDFSSGTMYFGLLQSIGNTGEVSPGNILVNYDNLVINVANGVPEVSTWAMLALGFAGLGFAGSRRGAKSPLGLG